MYGIKWFKGSNYYTVRGWLLKHGFYKTTDMGYNDKEQTKGFCKFDNGGEYITLYCTMKTGQNGNKQCDTVYDYTDTIYDNVNITFDKVKNLSEQIAYIIKKNLM